ncbi:hypothetical protein OG985_48045 [Streptomyces sp. NBC_00289]|uniref:hypothetical protein n=1 Tax=Streptomyces sp. NBC_00289 TaxID=2975703 RepID=UPI00324B9349
MHLILSPVGADSDLRAALEDLKLGRYAAARDLLHRTGSNWSLLASRSQLLAADAGLRGILKMWRDEEPANQYASMLWARALTQGATDLARRGQSLSVMGRAASMAQQEWKRAADLWPQSPEPWCGRLQLSRLPFDPILLDPLRRSRPLPWDRLNDPTMHFPGPWPLLAEANVRHPGSRDGHHRMREHFLYRAGAGVSLQYAQWLVSGRLENPELLMLPLYALMDLYRAQHGKGQSGALQFWQTAQVAHYATRAYEEWFAHVPPTEYCWVSHWDLNHLAHALVACGQTARAAKVFRALGPYATPQPWKDVNDSLGRSKEWADEFLRIRTAVLDRAVSA